MSENRLGAQSDQQAQRQTKFGRQYLPPDPNLSLWSPMSRRCSNLCRLEPVEPLEAPELPVLPEPVEFPEEPDALEPAATLPVVALAVGEEAVPPQAGESQRTDAACNEF